MHFASNIDKVKWQKKRGKYKVDFSLKQEMIGAMKMEQDIRDLFQIFTRRFGFLNKLCCHVGGHDLSLVQSHILFEVNRQEHYRMQQLAETLGTDITTFSRQVQSLVRMNLVEKTQDLKDRRISILSLTSAGKAVISEINQQMNLYLEDIFSTMSKEEKKIVIQSLELLNECMARSSKCCKPPIG